MVMTHKYDSHDGEEHDCFPLLQSLSCLPYSLARLDDARLLLFEGEDVFELRVVMLCQ